MKRCSVSLITGKRKSKSQKSYHFVPNRTPIAKTTENKTKQKQSVGKDVEKVESLCSIGENVKWCSCRGTLW